MNPGLAGGALARSPPAATDAEGLSTVCEIGVDVLIV